MNCTVLYGTIYLQTILWCGQ